MRKIGRRCRDLEALHFRGGEFGGFDLRRFDCTAGMMVVPRVCEGQIGDGLNRDRKDCSPDQPCKPVP